MNHSTKTFRTAFWLMLTAQLLIILYSFLMEDLSTASLQTTTRLSGRLSLALFSWLVIIHLRDQQYKSLFLIFAVAHGIHMLELISYQYVLGNISSLVTPRVAGGMIAYVFIYLMPVIESRKPGLSEHTVIKIEYFYLLFIWGSFVMAYIPRLFSTKIYGGSYFEFVILFAWLISLFLWKLYYTFTEKAPKVIDPHR
jgi:hypothetical protein